MYSDDLRLSMLSCVLSNDRNVLLEVLQYMLLASLYFSSTYYNVICNKVSFLSFFSHTLERIQRYTALFNINVFSLSYRT